MTFETMIANISNIVSNTTSDATAVAEQILTGQTAYVNGNKITGTMVNNEAVETTTLNAGENYIIPKGYHNGNGKVTANSLEGQTQATATANNISAGKTAWVNGKLITGNGADNTTYYNNGMNDADSRIVSEIIPCSMTINKSTSSSVYTANVNTTLTKVLYTSIQSVSFTGARPVLQSLSLGLNNKTVTVTFNGKCENSDGNLSVNILVVGYK